MRAALKTKRESPWTSYTARHHQSGGPRRAQSADVFLPTFPSPPVTPAFSPSSLSTPATPLSHGPAAPPRRHLTRARALLRDYALEGEGDPQLGFVHIALRRKAFARGDYVEAFRCAKRSLAVFTAALGGDAARLAHHVSHYAASLSRAGQTKRGYTEALRALSLHEGGEAAGGSPVGDAPGLLRVVGDCAVAAGHLAAGKRFLERAVDAAGASTLEYCSCMTSLADLMLLMGKPDRARRLVTRLLSSWSGVFGAVGDQRRWERASAQSRPTFCAAAAVCGALHWRRGCGELAAPFLRQAVAVCAEKPLFFQAEAHALMAEMALATEGAASITALAQCRRAVMLAGECTLSPLHSCRAVAIAGRVHVGLGGEANLAAAESCFDRALQSLASLCVRPEESHPLMGEVQLRLAYLYRDDGRHADATRAYGLARKALHAALPPSDPLVQQSQSPTLPAAAAAP